MNCGMTAAQPPIQLRRIHRAPRRAPAVPRTAAAVALAVVIAGCSNSQKGTARKPPVDEAPQVTLIMKSLANEFFSTMAEGARQHHRTHAGDYDLTVNGIKDELDLGRQVSLVEEAVAGGADAIVIAPADSKALIPALRKAIQRGVVVVNIDNRLDAALLRQEGLRIPFVGPDNRAGARRVGEYLATKLAQGDAVAILEGLRTSENGRARREGFEEAMQVAGMNIVDSQSGEWEMSKANALAASMLSEHPEIKAILAANDSMALGALAAVKSAGRTGEVQIVGFDNIAAIQQAIREGKVLATADQHGDQLAVYGIEVARRLLADSQTKVEDEETPADLVTSETLSK